MELEFDKNDPVNAGVFSDRLGVFTSNGSSMRIIEYMRHGNGRENDLLHHSW